MTIDVSNISAYPCEEIDIPPEHAFRFNQPTKTIMTITKEGKIIVDQDAPADETARKVLEAMENHLVHMVDAAYQRGFEDGRKI